MIALVDVSADVRDALRERQLVTFECASVQRIEAEAEDPREQVEAVVIGTGVQNPVQGASHAYRLDPGLSVIILGADDQQCERIRVALRFAPLIGRDVVCSNAHGEQVVYAIQDAAGRTRARRMHQRTLRALQSKLEPSRGQQVPLRDRYATQLMELAPVGIIATDPEQRVVSANAEATRILRMSERGMLGRTVVPELFGIDVESPWRKLLREATEEPSAPMMFEHTTGQTNQVLEARAVTVSSTAGGGYLVVFQDISPRVRLEQQKELALKRAEEASRLKDEFLATISHELRTPLNAILGWSRLLRTQLTPEKRVRALETIERNALAQSQLIDDLLDITRITTGKLRLEIEDVQLTAVIEAAVETVRPSIEAKQLGLTMALDRTADRISGDPQRLQQVIWNLLSNAVKFSPKGTGHIHVLLERVGSHLELTIRDNGQGIAPEFLPLVFDSFRQADASATRRHGGLGLGLAITKHLVELHGGTLSAHSEGLGQGASFGVRLPIAPLRAAARMRSRLSPSPDPLEAAEAPPELRQLRVLVVDDEEDSRELLADVLASCGANVRLAASVAEALEQFDAFRPSVVVSDIGMPGEDGYSFITKLRSRSREHGGATPVAALTAYARAEDRRRALEAGFQMHVVKPVEPDELVAVVATLARMAKLVE